MKTKKILNRMSDMGMLRPVMPEQVLLRLQKERLMHTQLPDEPEQQFAEEIVEEAKNEEKEQLQFVSVNEALSVDSKTVSRDISLPNTRSEEINLLPYALSPSKGRFEAFKVKHLKTLSVFVGVCLLMLSVFPLLQAVEKARMTQGAVLGAAISGYDIFNNAKGALFASDFETAQAGFAAARQRFAQSREELQELGSIARFLPQAEQAELLLSAAGDGTLALQYFSLGLEGLLALRVSPEGIRSVGSEQDLNLQDSTTYLSEATKYANQARLTIEKIDASVLPYEYQVQIESVRELMRVYSPLLESSRTLLDLVSAFVGQKNVTYLLLFQNYRELRATGGFIGTYGLLDIDKGSINRLKIETVYNPDGQLQAKIAAPGPLQYKLTKGWFMRDSNWFFDFPVSARKAAELLKSSVGEEVDGVIAFTPEIFIKILNIIGPVEMPEYGVVLTDDNFVDIVQYQTSEAYDKVANTPKKFLADFAPKALEKLSQLDSNSIIKFWDVLLTSLDRRDIQIAAFNDLSERISDFGWDGSVREAPVDYLAVVNSNVGAGKTDQNIQQEINVQTTITEEGKVVNRLVITRTHIPGTETKHPVNLSFVRVFVPEGSRLLSSSGFDEIGYIPSSLQGYETDPDLAAIDQNTLIGAQSKTLIYNESGKTVFANWASLAPGETHTAELEYELPFSYNSTSSKAFAHSLLVQRQAGSPSTHVRSVLKLPSWLVSTWAYPEAVAREKGNIIFESDLERDLAWGAVLEPVQSIAGDQN